MMERTLSYMEYKAKFGSAACQRCGSRSVKCSERTKDSSVYKIYVCAGCKNVIKREYK
jgi:hypothetical protein